MIDPSERRDERAHGGQRVRTEREPEDRERAQRSQARPPLTVVKKLASGVPKCGVLIVVMLTSRSRQARAPGGAASEALGDATSRASSPPVECPIR